MISVYYTSVQEQLPDFLYQEQLSRLPEQLQERNVRFRQWKDRLLHLTGKLLLIEALQQFGFGDKCLYNLQYDQYNRPFIEGDIDFNISHSGNYVLCAIGQNMHLGIDIEQIRDIDFSDFEQVMTTYQWNIIKNAPSQEKQFFQYWAVKESVIKADRRGLAIPLNDIEIEDNVAYCDDKKWHLKELNIDNEYSAFLAVNKCCSHMLIERNYKQLFK